MKRFNKKGFTIVELVIVIAVIGILAGVLIPTFSSITQKAQESAALQEATAGRDAILALTQGSMPEATKFINGDVKNNVFTTKFAFNYHSGRMETITEETLAIAKYDNTSFTVEDTTYAGYYACYVSDDVVGTTRAASAFTMAGYEDSIAKLLGCPDADLTTVELKLNSEYYELTFTVTGSAPTMVRVYWTSDINETLIIFLGNVK